MGKRTSVLGLSLMLIGIAAFFVGTSHGSTADTSKAAPQKATAPVQAAAASQMPTAFFTKNMGQVSNREVQYYTRSGTMQVGFTKGAVLMRLMEPMGREGQKSTREVLVRTTFAESNEVSPEARGKLGHRSNYFRGKDPAGWHSDVTNYGEVVYSGLYDGIDLVYKATPKGLKYDFIVHPGADPSRIVITHEGIEGLEVGTTGELVLHTALGDLRDAAPSASQGPGKNVRCRFETRSPNSYGFVCEGWDRSRKLIIDPLIYSTYVGGVATDYGNSIATDTSGNAYVTGTSIAPKFPTTPGAYDPVGIGPLYGDVIVFKLDSTGSTLVYSTYVCGSDNDNGYGIAVSSTGQAVVTGRTVSDDFPTTAGAYEETHNSPGIWDAFVFRLDPSGSTLEYSTFIGGSPSSSGGGGGKGKKGGGGGSSGGIDYARAIALDSSGEAVIAGYTASTDFPTTLGAYDTTFNGDGDVFLCRLNADGSDLVFSTFLGGSGGETAYGVALDGYGDAYVVGWTNSSSFPTTDGAYDTKKSSTDAFVSKFDASGSVLVYSTFLGGRKSDQGMEIAVDASGNAHVLGETSSPNFPTTSGAYQTSLGGYWDVFVTKLNASGSDLVWSTYLGGSGYETVSAYTNPLALDSAERAVVTGQTFSTDFPTTPGAFDTILDGSSDAYVTVFSLDGASLVYSTYLGGSDHDDGRGIAVDAADDVFVTGTTHSTDYPTTAGAFDETYNGGNMDCFVTKLSLVP